MSSSDSLAPEKVGSLRALEAANFFLADVQTGLGPFLAAYLAGAGWEPARVGVALSVAGIVAVLLQTPAGAVVDRVRLKRLLLIVAAAVLAVGAALLSWTAAPWSVYTSQVLIGVAGPFLAPTLAALTMGLVGRRIFDRQFGKNQAFNSAGNVFCALSIAGSDDGRVHVVKAVLVEILVDGESQRVPDAQHRAEGVGARAQVGNLAQKLQRVPLGLQGILLRVGHAVDVYMGNLHFYRLPRSLRRHQRAGNGYAGPRSNQFQGFVGQLTG